MGLDGGLGPKKHRKAEEAVGEPLHRAVVTKHPMVECVTPDDRHYVWNRTTGEVTPRPEPRWHFTSCPSRT